ncbi:hypothetical protein BKA67DRAFT_664063 [Truncatella angustata]|uniref:Uncharacterized protein n=1 Tax=Truncatella angustata TaxID=152316 RepID=A0A9P8RN51_9PEZI|nr:uncharacterized protein BKA67DRAFT_664063 [Truncatella angustata]KAH6646211.1 hypothetical protein BKA67DRAFT_664063 [Truncatella angustata]KAH8203977.1 hypothetical protein TruAng_001919 [Truncatella angustata]
MADSRRRVSFTYNGPQEYFDLGDKVRKLIQDDTGTENWIATRSLPPFEHPPPMSSKAIDELKKMPGVKVQDVEQDD